MKTREQIEMELWKEVYITSLELIGQGRDNIIAYEVSDYALERFRKAFPVSKPEDFADMVPDKPLVNHSENCKGCSGCHYDNDNVVYDICDTCIHENKTSSECKRIS